MRGQPKGVTNGTLVVSRCSKVANAADCACLLQVRDKVGYAAIQALRWGFDRACGYGPNMSERQWLRRMLFLETVAGVPGMVAGKPAVLTSGGR